MSFDMGRKITSYFFSLFSWPYIRGLGARISTNENMAFSMRTLGGKVPKRKKTEDDDGGFFSKSYHDAFWGLRFPLMFLLVFFSKTISREYRM